MAHDESRRDVPRDEAAGAPGHAASRREIARLTEEVLPALIGRLGASDLGELEVREGDWRVRLRKPAAVANGSQSGSGSRSKRRRQQQAAEREAARAAATSASSSAAATGSGRSSAAGDSSGAQGSSASTSSGNGAHPSLAAVGPGRTTGTPPRPELARRAATSPAVGYYLPSEQISPGHRVQAGDLLGHIDVLGVRQDVVSPADGVVGRLLAQSGEAVEYGQELLRIDLVPAAPERSEPPAET